MTPDTPTMTAKDALGDITDTVAVMRPEIRALRNNPNAPSGLAFLLDRLCADLDRDAAALRAALAAKDAEIKQLHSALETAMLYLPHGRRYQGPSCLTTDDQDAFDQCYAALKP